MLRTSAACLAALLLSVGTSGCVSESVEDEIGQEEAAAMSTSREPGLSADLIRSPTPQYVTGNWNRRYWANSYNWSANGCWGDGDCVAIFNGLWGHSVDTWFSAWGTNAYCTSYSWGNQCNSSYDTWFINKGWGWRYRNGFGSWDYEGQQPAASGWSTLGQHPYWCTGSGASNTWQGWSSTNHC